MAFDFYLYQHQLSTPDFDEAMSVVEEDPTTQTAEATGEEKDRQRAIYEALLKVNPRLERFQLDHKAIAEIENISHEEAQLRFDYIELNTPEGDLATTIDIFRNYVAVTIPYWYEGQEADEAFSLADEYAKAINRTAGYFAFDPQTGRTYDPSVENLTASKLYEGASKNIGNPKTVVGDPQEMISDPMEEDYVYTPKKPWWKFW